MGNETKAASFLMGGIVGVLIGCLGTVYMYTYSEKQEQRQRNLRAREERYAREWEESEKKVVGNVKNYFYNGKKLVISAQDDSSNFFSLAVLEDSSRRMDSLAGLLMNTTKVHSVSFPQGNLRGDITAEELLEKYWQYGQNPHYTNETSWYKSGETKEVVRNAERVSVD